MSSLIHQNTRIRRVRSFRHCEEGAARRGNLWGVAQCSKWRKGLRMFKQPAVYIMANKKNGTLYTGVTSDLIKRVYEHKQGITKGFAHKYNCKKLMYYALFETMELAILEEKRIKAGSRKKKIDMIESLNSEWKDLYDEITK